LEVRELNNTTTILLEFDKVKERLKEYAVSDKGMEIIERLEPSIDIRKIKAWLDETTEAKTLVNKSSSIPLHSLTGINGILEKLNKNALPSPEELSQLSVFLKDGEKLKRFMKDREDIAPNISLYALSISGLQDVSSEIERCIRNGRVDDGAAPELGKVRKKIISTEDKVKDRLEGILRSNAYRQYLRDSFVSIKNGRYVIPVKSEYRAYVKGSVVDSSSSSSTLFIEPEGIRNLQDELDSLKIQEDNEVYKVLYYLAGLVSDCQREISINMETMAQYDFIFAKAKYSRTLSGNSVLLNEDGFVKIVNGRHPLIDSSPVPLNFSLGRDYRALVITGPNTGGKTVAIKTVGLLSMMVQCGLHVPVDEGSEFTIFKDILADIGDGQSIQESLSTFSSHIRNIISILECAGPRVLVILDELGSGTDPKEGMGLAVSILETLFKKGASILATTHHSELKELPERMDGFENGRMEFDINTLKPLYKLKIGESGESNALLIALKLGLDKNVIERAHEVTYREKKSYEVYSGPANAVRNEEVIKQHEELETKIKEKTRVEKIAEGQNKVSQCKIGDCVYVSSLGRTGIVYELENSKGEVGIIYEKKKIKVNKKRLSLYIDSKELYPEEYNFDIIFESKENRKKRHIMDKRHVEGMAIEIPETK
jgi:MutS2 family protein